MGEKGTDIIEFINSDLLDRYARWIAFEDMKRGGIPLLLVKIDNVNKSNKEI